MISQNHLCGHVLGVLSVWLGDCFPDVDFATLTRDTVNSCSVYWDRSMITVALPLFGERIWIELSRLMSRRAESSSLERLGLAGFALRNTLLIFTRTSSATVLLRRRNVGSTDWMISSVGMDLGVELVTG